MAISAASLAIDGNQTIGTLLSGKIGLCVPPSQRSYRWKKEHVEALLTDIKENLLEDEYFLGSVVTVALNNKQTFVYDGQQRLATSMILIGAIRDQFLKMGDEENAEIVEGDSLFSKKRGLDKIPHFILNGNDHSFFFNRVVLRPDEPDRKALSGKTTRAANEKVILPPSHKRIDDAAKTVATYVSDKIVAGLPEDDAKARLHSWLDFIEESLRIILIKVTDERTAFTIFETMNDRGLRLSAADLLKNRLYAIAGTRQAEVIQTWNSMTGVLEAVEGQDESVLEYIRCYWVSQYGHTRTKDLYDRMKEKAKNPAQAVKLAADLEQSAQDYAAIVLSSHPKWVSRGANLRSKIETIQLLGVTQLRPVLLAAINKFTNKEYSLLLDACVTWSVRSLLGGVSSGSIESYYAKAAQKITRGELKKASDVKKEMSGVIPNDKRFEDSVKTVSVAQQRIARYYLNALQRTKDSIPEPQYIPNAGDEITLEHILPEKPKNGEWDQFSADEKKQYVHRLGNLALLTGTDNSTVGNVEYILKKPTLKKSKFSLTSMTGGLTIWRKQDIEKRQEGLAKLAIKTWPL